MSHKLKRRKGSGFTLIELLIVIAIILILIAIALPNFLEAQVRAKVTEVKAELRSLNIALTSYFLDWTIYPDDQDSHSTSGGLFKLTSPIPYMKEVQYNPFGDVGRQRGLRADRPMFHHFSYSYQGLEAGDTFQKCRDCLVTWLVYSGGPDDGEEIRESDPHYRYENRHYFSYSATNGTKSRGDLHYWGGDSLFFGVNQSTANRSTAHDVALRRPLLIDYLFYYHTQPPNR